MKTWSLHRKFAPYLFVLPFVVLFCTFLLYPLVRSLLLSVNNPVTGRFIGLAHYRYILSDRLFWWACANTVLFAVAFLSVQVPGSLCLAMLLNSPRVRFRGAF